MGENFAYVECSYCLKKFISIVDCMIHCRNEHKDKPTVRCTNYWAPEPNSLFPEPDPIVDPQ